jgi:hypothetical protein
MKRNLILLVTFCLLLVACQPATTGTPAAASTSAAASAVPTTAAKSTVAKPTRTPRPVQPTLPSGALLQVIKPDGSTVDLKLDDLKKLPLANITVDGKVEEGPKLIDVLKAAGVTDFSQVIVSGSSDTVTLTKAQVDDNTILDFNNHGTLKFASTYIPKANWTKEVTKIEVK